MKNTLLLLLASVLIGSSWGCSREEACPEWLEVEIVTNTTIKRLNIYLEGGIGTVRFTDTSIIVPAYVGAQIRVASSHAKDTVMTVTAQGRNYEIEPRGQALIPVYCN